MRICHAYPFLVPISCVIIPCFSLKCCSFVTDVQKEEGDCVLCPVSGILYDIKSKFELLHFCMCLTISLVFNCLQMNIHSQGIIGSHNNSAHCIPIVSTSCPLPQQHLLLFYYVASLCMLASLSTICSKL